MHKLINISSREEIPSAYRNNPIGRLLEYHNLSIPFDKHPTADLIIGTCIDFRINLRLPDNFAYIIRAGGGSMIYNEFKISFIVSVKGIKQLALIGHTDCSMAHLGKYQEQFVDGLIQNAGWNRESAEDHFIELAPESEIGNEIEFVISESKRLQSLYPTISVVPLLYKVEDHRLYLVKE
jgi:carbonic anhydrase